MPFTYKRKVLQWVLPLLFFSEICLQYIENTAIYDILRHNNIAGYFRYVDDILINYNKTTTDILDVFNSFNTLMPTMKFTIESEMENKINFMDITIVKERDKLAFNIYIVNYNWPHYSE
jgi:hypothetical protein